MGSGRNTPCSCGSGKKYKRCCMGQDTGGAAPLTDEIMAARMLTLEHDRSVRDEAESRLLRFRQAPGLAAHTASEIDLSLVTVAQRRGDHQGALDRLDAMSGRVSSAVRQNMKQLRATSLTHLGDAPAGARIFDKLLKEDGHDVFRPWWCLEAGRTYRLAGRTADAITVTREAVRLFEAQDELEHLTRARSNLGGFMLYSEDSDEVAQGEALLEEMCDVKIGIGDIEGAANNFSQLSMHCFRLKRFERAIAYGRKDLMLARVQGDERGLAATLGNLAVMYVELRQLTQARKHNAEALEIGQRLQNPEILAKTEGIIRMIEAQGKAAGIAGIPLGPIAPCACESGKTYEACCGRADHEPLALRMPVGGESEDVQPLAGDLRRLGLEPGPLDFAMRETDEARRRVSWSEMRGHDGWFEVLELPDMANIHLNAAEALIQHAQPDSVDEPLACAMLAVSGLEAFINSTIYFAREASDSRPLDLPAGLVEDAAKYQRLTELTLKWDELGKAMCGLTWPPPPALWRAFTQLVQIRNELVHFKAEGFVRVAPTEKLPPHQLRGLPAEISIRAIPHSWPMRLLTPSFGRWAVSTARALVSHFRTGYMATRIAAGEPASSPSDESRGAA